MRAVNLLPRDHGQRTIKKESLPVLVGACSAVLVLARLGAMFMMGSGKIAAQQRTLGDLNRRFEALPPPPPGPTAAQQALAGEQSARVTALSAALASRVSWDRVFREFSLVLPEDVWLTELNAKSPISPATNASSSTGVGTPSEFTITGRTYSHDGVARLLSRLQVVPDLTNVQLVSSTLSKIGKQSVVDFTIAADISFDSITPQPAVGITSYSVLPISVTFNGNFYNLADFLYRLRSLVTVHAGRLDATGRLFAVDTLTFNESTLKFPNIQASLVIDAFVYAAAPAPAAAPAVTPPATGTATTTPTTTTTDSSSTSASATGAP